MGLGRWDVYCLFLNANIGAGVMLLPAIFQRSGVAAAMMCLVVVGVISWLLQVELVAVSDALSEEAEAKSLSEPLIAVKKVKYQWDLPEIVQVLMGSVHSLLYFLLYYLALTSSLSAYANLTGTGIGTLVFHCDYTGNETTTECMHTYHFSLLFYLVVVCLLTLVDYKEQAWLQTVMTYSRYFLIVVILAYAVYKASPSEITPENAIFNSLPDLGIACSVLLFSGLYQVCAPSIMYESDITHTDHSIVAQWVSISTVGLYALLGFVGLVVPGLPDNISLLFATETYGYSSDSVPFLLQTLNLVVICVPVFQVWTNSPILGQSLAGILTTWVYGPNHTKVRAAHPLLFRAIRCLVLCPPVLLAALSHRLSPVITFSGNFLFILLLVYLPLCYNLAKAKFPLNFSCAGVKGFNYGLAAFGAVSFLYLSSSFV